MSPVAVLEFLHVFSAVWLISGIVGRSLAIRQAARTANIQGVAALAELAGQFERIMVQPGSFVVVALGLATGWFQGQPLFGVLQGSSVNWLLASLVLYLTMIPVVIFVFLPRGRLFGTALDDAVAQGKLTPELRAAFNDRAVAIARAYELLLIVVVLILMVTKPI